MLLTRCGHACVRIEHAGGRLVIDPGNLSDPAAVEGADAVLVTNAEFDHFSEALVRAAAAAAPALQVWTVPSVAEGLVDLGDRVHTVRHGDVFTAAGLSVQAFGSEHARVHPDVPVVPNSGFLVASAVFHPGDALTVPGVPVHTLLVPLHGAWARLGDVVDWVRAVAPRQAIGIHECGLSRLGRALVDGFLGPNGPGLGTVYLRLGPLGALELPVAGAAPVARTPRAAAGEADVPG